MFGNKKSLKRKIEESSALSAPFTVSAGERQPISMDLNDIFPPVDPELIIDDEDGQTYEEFVEIGKRLPNAKGTGRFKMSRRRNKLAVFYFGSASKKAPYIPHLLRFMKSCFMLEVDYFEQYDALNLETNTFHLDDNDYDINVDIPSSKKRSAKTRQKSKVDVFSLFDVLVHKAKTPYYSIVGLFDCFLYDDGCEVMGRACGNRVCCVSLPSCDDIHSLFSVTCHELLHTMGFDHEMNERCIMNAICSDNWIFLGNENVRKLKLFHSELFTRIASMAKQDAVDAASWREFMVSYHRGLKECIDEFEGEVKVEFKTHHKWLSNVILYFSSQFVDLT